MYQPEEVGKSTRKDMKSKTLQDCSEAVLRQVYHAFERITKILNFRQKLSNGCRQLIVQLDLGEFAMSSSVFE